MPDQCRMPLSADIDAYPFQHTPQFGNRKVSSQAIENREEVVTIATQAVEKAGISDQEFSIMLSNVPKLTSIQLSQLEATIQRHKQDFPKER